MNSHYEVLVIGGGIHGVGVAQAAAAKGFSSLIVEQSDWAAGTSSKSSKLIHGGLRYLQSFEFSLVRECLQEREHLLRNAPDLVKLNTFYIPLYRHSSYRPWQLATGLTLYALLAGLRKEYRYRKLPKSSWNQFEGLRRDQLECVFAYQDAQTDDALLTRAVVQSAMQLGAHALTQTEFVQAKRDNDHWQVTLAVQGNNPLREVTCKLLINTAGPWVNQVLARIQPSPAPLPIDLVQGSHLVLEDPITSACFYLESPSDQRAVFALPWRGKTLLGTTEKLFQGDPSQCAPSAEEEAYLLEVLAHYFPRHPINILDRFAGLRVLPRTEGRFFSRSRETLLISDQAKPHLISLYGGKLTSYRASAEKVFKLAQSTLGPGRPIADTRTIKLRLP